MNEDTLKEMLISISLQVKTVQKQLDELKKNGELVQNEFLTMRGLAQLAGIPVSTAYQLSCRNILPKFRVGKRVLFRRADVIRMIENTRVASTSEIRDKAITELMTEDHHDA